MNKEPVLIFGGTGFLGRQISKVLISDGCDVVAIGRNFSQGLNTKFIMGDLSDKQRVFEIINMFKPKIVINAAWYTSQNDYRNSSLNYIYRDNAINLVDICNNLKISRLITLGSCAEYGTDQQAAIAGSTQLNPQDLYSESKVEVFKYTSKNYEHDWVWARVFQPYGISQDKNRLIPYIIKCFSDGVEPNIKYPENYSDWITSRDVGSAISFIIEKQLSNELDIGSGTLTTNFEITEMLRNKIHSSKSIIENKILGSGVVASNQSPLFKNGWRPGDNLSAGLDWVLKAT